MHFKKAWQGWDIFHPIHTYSSLKFNLKCGFRVFSFFFYHHPLWCMIMTGRTKNSTFLWASFSKWPHLLAANDLKEQRNWICQKIPHGFPTNQSYICHSWFSLNSLFFETPCSSEAKTVFFWKGVLLESARTNKYVPFPESWFITVASDHCPYNLSQLQCPLSWPSAGGGPMSRLSKLSI